MELKYNDIVEFCKNNGTKKEVGIGKNKRVVYELRVNDFAMVSKLYFSVINIKYDGSEAYQYPSIIGYIRYNETTDCLQAGFYPYSLYNIKWKTLKVNDNQRITRDGFEVFCFNTIDEANDYLSTYYNDHIDIAKKNAENEIKKIKREIKNYQRSLKMYEKRLVELESIESKIKNI